MDLFSLRLCFFPSRDPQALVKPLDPAEASEALLEERQEMVKKFTPKVTRRIILVRHGHYNYLHDDQDDKEHNLTAKGREQARITGARLQEYMRLLKENLVDRCQY